MPPTEEKGRPESLRVKAYRSDPDGGLLGPLDATHFAVGDVKVLRGLRGGLNDRAIQAVRQWRFAPGRMKGVPVDVVVEVGVEFRLR